MSELIFLSNVRLSFPHIAEPQRQPKQDGSGERISYNCEFILPPDHPGFAQFYNLVTKMAVEKWADKAGAILQMIQNDRKFRCFGRGEEKINSKTVLPYDGYPGMLYISCGRDKMPQIIKPDGTPVDPMNTMEAQAIARQMYGGCYVNAAVKPWLQENKHGRAVRCDFVAIQFLADGQPFGEGAVDASGLFGATPQAAAGAPAMPGFGAAPAAPAWGAPQVPGAPVAMPPAPFPGAAPAPAGLPSFLS